MALEIIGIVLIIIGLLMLGLNMEISKLNNNRPHKKRTKLSNLAILIPARDESLVIEDLLISIKEQSQKVKMQDVYIIVESAEDKTISIAKKYGATIFIRQKLHLKSKGYALDELIKDLVKKDIYYDAYFIIDADNILDKDFILNMEKSYIEGYDIAMGYRNLKNGNDSIIAACSGITFAFINTSGNALKSRDSRNITLSGTGLFIAGNLIKKWQSFPFHSLTEDYELTLYSILNNLTSVYNKEAIFYDEQPTKYKNTINQRIRWIRGYFDNRKKYIPEFKKRLKNNPNIGSLITEINGMRPYILMIIGVVLYLLNQIINIFTLYYVKIALFKIFLIIFLAYLLFALMTLFIIKKDNKIALTKKMRIKAILFSPLFFITYVPCALKAILKKNVTWDKVVHNKKGRS